MRHSCFLLCKSPSILTESLPIVKAQRKQKLSHVVFLILLQMTNGDLASLTLTVSVLSTLLSVLEKDEAMMVS